MTKLINGRTPEQDAAWNRWHAIVAALLAALLLILWFTGKGPGFATATGSCCGAAAPVAAVAAPVDSDSDGVVDSKDRCPNSPPGDRVGPNGCSCDVTVQTHFETDSADLTADDKAQLDGVATRLQEFEFVEGVASGHTDNVGDEAYNQTLSERRAQAVVDYLTAKGVAPGRFTATGYGASHSIADNSTEEGRAQNRRVVIRRTDCGPAN